ncbi:MAG: helix-turn-helix transcriptional regulator [Bacteroidetes bacterium]|nr:helix-turn-helix transcriptional regulator [Bacteroidota bacterium]
MSPSIARKVMLKMQEASAQIRPAEKPDYQLTPREKEVLACVVNGLSYKMVADKLSISYETVRSHIKNIYEKLHVVSLTSLVHKTMKEKII